MSGLGGELRALLVAGGSRHTALRVAVHGQPLDVEWSATYAAIGLVLLAHSHCEGVAHEFVGIKSANGISTLDRHQVHHIDESGEAVQSQPANDAAAQCLARPLQLSLNGNPDLNVM